MSYTDQSEYDVRVEHGFQGLAAVAAASIATIIVVDVLSFSTCVSVAVERGALVYPYPWQAGGLLPYAEARSAVAAGKRGDPSAPYSLSPASLTYASPGERIVLPSPNGSSLSFEARRYGRVIAGCFRNRSAIASFVSTDLYPVAVVAAGERWPDNSLRPALEDQLAVGAIVAALSGSRSPEADAAVAVFRGLGTELLSALMTCSSGRELAEQGFARDIEVAAELDSCKLVPVLTGEYFSAA
jgi:2-phosphosulfolactate phosphatase